MVKVGDKVQTKVRRVRLNLSDINAGTVGRVTSQQTANRFMVVFKTEHMRTEQCAVYDATELEVK